MESDEMKVMSAVLDAFRCGSSWSTLAPSVKLLYIANPPSPLSPEQRAALADAKRAGWNVTTGHEYVLGMGEWNAA